MDQVTFATSSGALWLAIADHFAAGVVSIVAETIALSVAKGGRLHKHSGMVFTWGTRSRSGRRPCASASVGKKRP
jgi:hypothetical protein